MNIKAIETIHPIKGYRFRSRLEARWAVFFEVIGIEYEYESEGFCLNSNVFYLPDFYLPRWGLFIEVKGTYPSDLEQSKCELLYKSTGLPVWLTWGAIPSAESIMWASYTDDDGGGEGSTYLCGMPCPFYVCPCCNLAFPNMNSRPEYDFYRGDISDNLKLEWHCPCKQRPIRWETPKRALAVANGARFEHGRNTFIDIARGVYQ